MLTSEVRHDGHEITAWKAQLQDGAAGVFGSGPAAAETTPTVDLKSLHAKIGEAFLSAELGSRAAACAERGDRSEALLAAEKGTFGGPHGQTKPPRAG